MTYQRRIKREMKQLSEGGGHAMSRYRRSDTATYSVRSDCAKCPAHVELSFDPFGRRSFAPRGRAPFARCRATRARRRGGNVKESKR